MIVKYKKREAASAGLLWVATFMLLIAVLAMCSGCAAMWPDENAEPIAPPAVCSGPKDCEAKWAAARRWVSDHAAFRVQTYAADYIQTYGPLPHDTSIAVEVSREPLDAERYQIVARVACGNSFGCVPGRNEALNDFNRTVAAAGGQP